MFHSLKKKAAGLTAKSVPEPDNYREAKDRLSHVHAALADAVARVDNCDTHWGHIIRDAHKFQEKLHDGYPKTDHVKVLLRGGEEHMHALHDEYGTEVDPASNHKKIVRNVKAYLAELKNIELDYKLVADAKREFEMYNHKVEGLDKHSKEGDKKSRNLDKLESSRVAYDTALKGTMTKIDGAYAKAPSMFTAVYVAYWLHQARMQKMVDSHFKPSIHYAKSHEISSTVSPPTAYVEKTKVQHKANLPSPVKKASDHTLSPLSESLSPTGTTTTTPEQATVTTTTTTTTD